MKVFLLQRCDLRDTCAAHLPIVPSQFRRNRQYKHIWSCFSQYFGKFLRGSSLVSPQSIAAGIGISNFLGVVFHVVFEFFILRFNEEDTTQLSGSILLWFLDSPFLFCFAFRCIRHTGCAASTGPFLSPKTRNASLFGPFVGRDGPLWEVWEIEISTQKTDFDHLSCLEPHIFGEENQSVSIPKTI